MIPLRDHNPTLQPPLVTYALIAMNVAVFAYQYVLLTPEQATRFVLQHGAVPAQLWPSLSGAYAPSLSTPVTSMFLHGGVMHLAMNMWFLHIFGDNVEDVLGHARFTVFYLICGVLAVFAHATMEPTSTVPMVGASGAISGVLGAYLVMHPRAWVQTFIPPLFLVEVPAVLFLVVWFVTQVVGGMGSLAASGAQTGVAFFAHIGGFVTGPLLLLVMNRGRSRRRVVLGPRRPLPRRRR